MIPMSCRRLARRLSCCAFRPAAIAAVAVLLALFAWPSPLAAVDPLWAPSGRNTGFFGGLALDPFDARTLYAVASSDNPYGTREVYRSTDGGGSWAFAHRGLGGRPIVVFEADPARRKTLYAANDDGEFFRSRNAGESWTRLSRVPRVPNRDAKQLVIVPGTGASPAILYLVGIDGWIARSLDGGSTWTNVLTLSTDEFIHGFAADPANGRRLYTSDGRQLLRSDDAGTTWRPLPAVGPGAEPWVNVAGVAPTSPSSLFVFTRGAIHRSTDGGSTWRRAPTPDPDAFGVSFAAGRTARGPLWAGFVNGKVMTSADGGASWRVDTQTSFQAWQIHVQAGTGIPFFLAGGAARRRVAPGRWQALSNDGFLIFGSATFSRGPDPSVIFRGTGGAASVDGGRTFLPTGVPPAVDAYYGYRVEIDPRHPAVRYSATSGGVYRSTDGGRTWTLRGPFTRPADLPYVITPERVARLAFIGGETLLGSLGCGVSRSTDGGASWRSVLPCTLDAGEPSNSADDVFQNLLEILVSPLDPRTIFVRTVEGRLFTAPSSAAEKTWLSRDGGATFEAVLFGPTRLTFAPSDPRRVYRVEKGGLWASRDGGSSFTRMSSLGFDQGLRDLEVDPQTPATLYAAVAGRGVLRSRDGGATWSAASNGLSSYQRLEINGLVAHPTERGLLYAYPSRGGLFAARFD